MDGWINGYWIMLPLGAVHPPNFPVKCTPITYVWYKIHYYQKFHFTLGHFSSHGNPAITSTASAPPTPIKTPPNPPPLGVWLSVPISRRPGYA